MLKQQLKKKMETTRDQFAEALYQKGLAIAEIELLKVTNFVVWNLEIFRQIMVVSCPYPCH